MKIQVTHIFGQLWHSLFSSTLGYNEFGQHWLLVIFKLVCMEVNEINGPSSCSHQAFTKISTKHVTGNTSKPYRGKTGAVFPTSGEKEYPKQLCEAMTTALVMFLSNKGVRFVSENFQHDTAMTTRHLRHHGKKPLPPLMAEYWLIADKSIAGGFSHSRPIKFIPKESENGGSVTDFGKMSEDDEKAYLQQLELDNATLTGTVVRATQNFSEVEQWFGVCRTPEQSVQAAVKICHPIDMQKPLPDLLLKAIAMVLELGPQKVVYQVGRHTAAESWIEARRCARLKWSCAQNWTLKLQLS